MLRLLICARDLSSMAVDHHTMFALLGPKKNVQSRVTRREVFSVLLFHVSCLYSSAMS